MCQTFNSPTLEKDGNVLARRSFLQSASAMGLGVLMGAGGLKSNTFAQSSSGGKTASGRGTTQQVDDEIEESKDAETGARVRRLTADGSDNVHIYFTSESFVDGGSDRLIIASNRSGRFQFYLLEIREARLVQLTDGENLSPNMACVDPAGRLFYFDGPHVAGDAA